MSEIEFDLTKGETIRWVIAKEMMSKLLSFASDEEEEEEIISSWGFKEEFKRLQQTAEIVQALLFDITTNRQTRLESVGIWVEKLNTVAYEVDAMLQEFNYQTLRLKLEINSKMDSLLFRLKITSINKSLDEIYKQRTQIGLVRLQGVNSLDANVLHTQIRPTHPYLDDSKVWGREAEVSETVDKLCSSRENEKHLSVLAIVGIGGLGKTTLARLVCNHDKVVRHFDEIIRITVSDDFNVTRLLNKMVESLTGKNLEL